MKWILPFIFLALSARAADEDYKKLVDRCGSCNQIENLVIKHNSETSPDDRLALALKIAKIIEKISVKNKAEVEQRREIYFAIKGTIQVIDDDFDSETCLRLLDLRGQSKKSFDYVFHRFSLADQQNLFQRMRSFKEDLIRPKAELPEVKAIEP